VAPYEGITTTKGPIGRLELTEIWGGDDMWLYACFKQILQNFRNVIEMPLVHQPSLLF